MIAVRPAGSSDPQTRTPPPPPSQGPMIDHTLVLGRGFLVFVRGLERFGAVVSPRPSPWAGLNRKARRCAFPELHRPDRCGADRRRRGPWAAPSFQGPRGPSWSSFEMCSSARSRSPVRAYISDANAFTLISSGASSSARPVSRARLRKKSIVCFHLRVVFRHVRGKLVEAVFDRDLFRLSKIGAGCAHLALRRFRPSHQIQHFSVTRISRYSPIRRGSALHPRPSGQRDLQKAPYETRCDPDSAISRQGTIALPLQTFRAAAKPGTDSRAGTRCWRASRTASSGEFKRLLRLSELLVVIRQLLGGTTSLG